MRIHAEPPANRTWQQEAADGRPHLSVGERFPLPTKQKGPPSPTWEDTCGHLCSHTPAPVRHFSANTAQRYSGNPYPPVSPSGADSTLGPQPPCDSALANQSARIPSSTLIGQEGACAPIRTMRPQEICSYFERTADFFC